MRALTLPSQLDSDRNPAFLPAHCGERYRIPLSPEHLLPRKGDEGKWAWGSSHPWADAPTGSSMLLGGEWCAAKPRVRTNEKGGNRVWDATTVAFRCSSSLSYTKCLVGNRPLRAHDAGRTGALQSPGDKWCFSFWPYERLACIKSGGWDICHSSMNLLMLQGVLSLRRGSNKQPGVAYITECPRMSTLSHLPTFPWTFCS